MPSVSTAPFPDFLQIASPGGLPFGMNAGDSSQITPSVGTDSAGLLNFNFLMQSLAADSTVQARPAELPSPATAARGNQANEVQIPLPDGAELPAPKPTGMPATTRNVDVPQQDRPQVTAAEERTNPFPFQLEAIHRPTLKSLATLEREMLEQSGALSTRPADATVAAPLFELPVGLFDAPAGPDQVDAEIEAKPGQTSPALVPAAVPTISDTGLGSPVATTLVSNAEVERPATADLDLPVNVNAEPNVESSRHASSLQLRDRSIRPVPAVRDRADMQVLLELLSPIAHKSKLPPDSILEEPLQKSEPRSKVVASLQAELQQWAQTSAVPISELIVPTADADPDASPKSDGPIGDKQPLRQTANAPEFQATSNDAPRENGVQSPVRAQTGREPATDTRPLSVSSSGESSTRQPVRPIAPVAEEPDQGASISAFTHEPVVHSALGPDLPADTELPTDRATTVRQVAPTLSKENDEPAHRKSPVSASLPEADQSNQVRIKVASPTSSAVEVAATSSGDSAAVTNTVPLPQRAPSPEKQTLRFDQLSVESPTVDTQVSSKPSARTVTVDVRDPAVESSSVDSPPLQTNVNANVNAVESPLKQTDPNALSDHVQQPSPPSELTSIVGPSDSSPVTSLDNDSSIADPVLTGDHFGAFETFPASQNVTQHQSEIPLREGTVPRPETVTRDASSPGAGAQNASSTIPVEMLIEPLNQPVPRTAGTEKSVDQVVELVEDSTGGEESEAVGDSVMESSSLLEPLRPEASVEATLPARLEARTVEHIVMATVTELQSLQSGGSHRFRMRLDPPELGGITIEIHRKAGGATSIQITADLPETQTLLDQGSSELAKSLDEQGLSLSQFDLSQQQQQSDREQTTRLWEQFEKGQLAQEVHQQQQAGQGGSDPEVSQSVLNFKA